MPANVLRSILSELSSPPLLVGTVSAAVGERLQITLDDGSNSAARGAYAVGARVFFRPGGAVEGAAGSATVVDVIV